MFSKEYNFEKKSKKLCQNHGKNGRTREQLSTLPLLWARLLHCLFKAIVYLKRFNYPKHFWENTCKKCNSTWQSWLHLQVLAENSLHESSCDVPLSKKLSLAPCHALHSGTHVNSQNTHIFFDQFLIFFSFIFLHFGFLSFSHDSL
jgi:hypothetical protein